MWNNLCQIKSEGKSRKLKYSILKVKSGSGSMAHQIESENLNLLVPGSSPSLIRAYLYFSLSIEKAITQKIKKYPFSLYKPIFFLAIKITVNIYQLFFFLS